MHQPEPAPATDAEVQPTHADPSTLPKDENTLPTSSTPAPTESELADVETVSQTQTESASPLPPPRIAEPVVSRQSRALQNAVIDPVSAQQIIVCEQCGGPGVFWTGPTFSAKHVCAGNYNRVLLQGS